MVVPVFAVAVNQHMTVVGHFRALRYSPTLRFIVLGAMMYTLALAGETETALGPVLALLAGIRERE
jgi:cytochrome c oxidase cbb3-type subunit 1